jgi:hypothetical protein
MPGGIVSRMVLDDLFKAGRESWEKKVIEAAQRNSPVEITIEDQSHKHHVGFGGSSRRRVDWHYQVYVNSVPVIWESRLQLAQQRVAEISALLTSRGFIVSGSEAMPPPPPPLPPPPP